MKMNRMRLMKKKKNEEEKEGEDDEEEDGDEESTTRACECSGINWHFCNWECQCTCWE